MGNKRDLRLDEYEISKYRYRELCNFCLQYNEWKERLSECYSIGSSFYDGMPRNNSTPDPTARRADRAIELGRKCELVEQTAVEADSELYAWIIKAVTEGLSWEILQPPCGINQFYETRRKFFYLLSLKKK